MRRTWVCLQWLGVVLLGLAGCHSSPPKLKAPKLVEEYTIPPDDIRFSDPHFNYPKDSLKEKTKAKDPDMPMAPMTPSRFGAGSGPY